MNTNSQKTEREEAKEKASAKVALKFGQVEAGTVKFWHLTTIAGE